MKCIVLINNKLTRGGAINSYKMYTYKVNNDYEKLV